MPSRRFSRRVPRTSAAKTETAAQCLARFDEMHVTSTASIAYLLVHMYSHLEGARRARQRQWAPGEVVAGRRRAHGGNKTLASHSRQRAIALCSSASVGAMLGQVSLAHSHSQRPTGWLPMTCCFRQVCRPVGEDAFCRVAEWQNGRPDGAPCWSGRGAGTVVDAACRLGTRYLYIGCGECDRYKAREAPALIDCRRVSVAWVKLC